MSQRIIATTVGPKKPDNSAVETDKPVTGNGPIEGGRKNESKRENRTGGMESEAESGRDGGMGGEE